MRLIYLFCTAVAAAGCSKNEPPPGDVDFSYLFGPASPSTNGNRPEPFEVCEIAGPKDILVLARLETDINVKLAMCDETLPYWTGYGEAKLAILRQDGPAVSPKQLDSVWFFDWVAPGLHSETPAGTTVVASLRESRGSWIVTGAAEVDISDSNATATAGEGTSLPTRWSTLRDDAADTRQDFAGRCGPGDNPNRQKTMTDAEFDTFIHTDTPYPCRPLPDAGTVVDDRDVGS